MKALPFPCIRPAQDRVLEALPQMDAILGGNDALRGAIADGLMLKDPGSAYYVYECSGEPGRVTGVVAICPVSVLAGGDAASADAATAARAITEFKVQPRPVTLAYEASPVMDIILGAAKEGASLYAVTDPAGITHRVWEVKRNDAVASTLCSTRHRSLPPQTIRPMSPRWQGRHSSWQTRPALPAPTRARSRSTLSFPRCSLPRRSQVARRRFQRVCSLTRSHGSSELKR